MYHDGYEIHDTLNNNTLSYTCLATLHDSFLSHQGYKKSLAGGVK